MDPISQAVLGGHASNVLSKQKTHVKSAIVLGILSGMAPDLDIFIRSAQDPLLALEYHRQFSHSLFFIPMGALLCALLAFAFQKWIRLKFKNKFLNFRALPFKWMYLFCFFGWASHGLLDACTNYGTLLFWPFLFKRVAWNLISIIDPILTGVLALFLALAYKTKKTKFTYFAFVFCFIYFSASVLQRSRVRKTITAHSINLGHDKIEKLMLKPSLGNIFLWRVVYQYNKRFYFNAIRVGFREVKLYQGESLAVFSESQIKGLVKTDQQYKDILRFKWFAKGYLAFSKTDPNIIMDVRYALSPRSYQSFLQIQLNKQKPDQHIKRVRALNNVKLERDDFMGMLLGK